MEISYKQNYSQTEVLSRPPLHLEVVINTYQLRKSLIWKAGVEAFIGIWQSEVQVFILSDLRHVSPTTTAALETQRLRLVLSLWSEIPPWKWSVGPSLMKEQPLHLSPHCHFLPGGTTTVNIMMKQHQKTDRQSKWCESNIGSCRSSNVITTPYSQLLTSMSLLVGIQLRSCRAIHYGGIGDCFRMNHAFGGITDNVQWAVGPLSFQMDDL